MFHFSFFHLFLNQIVFIELSSYIWMKVFTWFTNQISKTINMKKIASIFFRAFLCLNCFTAISQPISFISRGIGGGGALYQPKINPANDDEFYVSCDMSELFHSTDFGISYSQAHHSKLQVFGTSTYEFTSDPDIAYSNFNDGNDGYPVKTTDGGNSWSKMPA